MATQSNAPTPKGTRGPNDLRSPRPRILADTRGHLPVEAKYVEEGDLLLRPGGTVVLVIQAPVTDGITTTIPYFDEDRTYLEIVLDPDALVTVLDLETSVTHPAAGLGTEDEIVEALDRATAQVERRQAEGNRRELDRACHHLDRLAEFLLLVRKLRSWHADELKAWDDEWRAATPKSAHASAEVAANLQAVEIVHAEAVAR